MEFDSNFSKKQFIKVGNDSGCCLASYKQLVENEHSTIIVYNKDEQSGLFKFNSKFK